MASVIKVQRGITVFGAAADSATATITAVGSLTKAFARITNIQKVSLDPDAGSSSDRNDDDIGCTCLLTSTTQITFTRETTGDNEDVAVWWEVWEYTGPGGGRDEFIVRVQENLVMGSGAFSANGTLFTSTNQANCCALVAGVSCSRTTEDFIHLGCRSTITGSGASTRAVVNRNGNGGSCTASIVVIEWTGADWHVERKAIGYSSAGSDTSVSITDVLDWAHAFILDCGLTSTVDGNDEIGDTVRKGSTTTELLARLRSGHSSPGSTDHNVMVVRNQKLQVQHYDSITGGGTDFSGGGAAPQTVDMAITAVPSTDTAAVQGYADNDTTTKEYPSAMWGFRLKDASTVQWKRTRTVGGGDWAFSVIDFSGVDGSTIFTKSLSAAATAAPALTKTFLSGTVAARVTRTVAEVLFKPGRPKVVPLALPSVPAALLQKNWADSCLLNSAWLDDVTRASSLAEDRRALSDRPRRVMKARLTALDRADQLKLFMAAQRWLSQRGSVPVYCDHSRVTQDSTGTSLFCSTKYRRFYVGGRVIVHAWTAKNRPTAVQYNTILEIRDDRLILGASLSGTVPKGSRVYPAMDAEIALDVQATPSGDRALDATVTFTEVVGPSALPASCQGNPPGAQYYSSKPILDVPPNWGATLELGLTRSGRAYEQGRGRVVAVEGARPQFQHTLTLTSLSRQAAWKVLQFFDAMKGRTRPFWLVQPETLFEPIAVTTTYVEVSASGNYADLNTYLDYVAIVKRDGTILIRGIASTTDSGSFWRITFDSAIPSTTLGEIRKCTGAFLVRMARSELAQEWVTDTACEVKIDVVELLDESTVAVAGITDSPSTVAPDTIPNLTLWVDAGKNVFHDDLIIGAPTDRNRPCEPYPDFSSTAHFWDDVRQETDHLSFPILAAGRPYLFGNSGGIKVVQFANTDLNKGRRALQRQASANYWSVVRGGKTSWGPLGYTLFICARTPKTAGATLGAWTRAFRQSDSAVMFEWGKTSLQMYITAGVVDSTMAISLADVIDGMIHVIAFRWDPGVSARVYYDGVLAGSAATSPSQMPTDVVGSERFNEFGGNTTLVADAAVGDTNGWFDNALLTFDRALTTSEMNAVGQYLAKMYGTTWTTIP